MSTPDDDATADTCTMDCVMGHTNEPGCLYDTTKEPGEQQPADVVTAEQQQDGAVGGEAAGRLAAFCDAWGAWGNAEVIECTLLGGIDRPLTLTDLDAVLAERTALTAMRFRPKRSAP